MITAEPSVMILGCGRSGTSIFGELFNDVGDFNYHSEPPFETVMCADFSRRQAFKVPHENDAYKPDIGLSFPLGELLRCVPRMQFFWIVRHPLDAISSLRVGISKDWGHHPRPPDWQQWLSRPIVEQCAHHWAFLNSVGFEHVRDRATVVRFEELIYDPTSFAVSVCDALDLDIAPQRDGIDRWARRVQNTNNADFVEAETSREYSRCDHSVRVGRWRENLTSADVSEVLPIIADVANSFGYELPG